MNNQYHDTPQNYNQTHVQGNFGQRRPSSSTSQSQPQAFPQPNYQPLDGGIEYTTRYAADWAHSHVGAANFPSSGTSQLNVHEINALTRSEREPPWQPRVTASRWEEENSHCFQVEANGIIVARREDNHMINGTNLLNVAGFTRERRDRILEAERTRHVVEIGPMQFQGVWIPFNRALEFANEENITELLYPLFVHNIGALLYHPTNQTRQIVDAPIGARSTNTQQQDLIKIATLPPNSDSGFSVLGAFQARASSPWTPTASSISRSLGNTSSAYEYGSGPTTATTPSSDRRSTVKPAPTARAVFPYGGSRSARYSSYDPFDGTPRATGHHEALHPFSETNTQEDNEEHGEDIVTTASNKSDQASFAASQGFGYPGLRTVHQRDRDSDTYHAQTGVEHSDAKVFPRPEHSPNDRVSAVEPVPQVWIGCVGDETMGETSQNEAPTWNRRPSFHDESTLPTQLASSDSTRGTNHNVDDESSARADTESASASTQDIEESVEHSPKTDELTVSIQAIVRDLQDRVGKLLCKTETQRRRVPMSPQKMPTLVRRRSLPLISASGPYQRTADYSDAHSTEETQGNEEHVTSESPPFHREGPASVGPDLGQPPNLSQLPISPDIVEVGSIRPVLGARARSEPPLHRVRLLLSQEAAFGIRAHGYAGGQEYNDSNGVQNGNSRLQGSSQKRKHRDSGEDEEREDDKRNGSGGKRRKILSPELQRCKARLPCLFYAGEPDRYPNHKKKYEYIAQLLRHLKSHNFYACSKCFTKFEDGTSSDAHDHNPCAKSCSWKSCKRHVPQGVERLSACECITSSEEQWRELFRLQYPSRAVPEAFDDESLEVVPLENGSQSNFNFDEFTIPGNLDLAESVFVNYTNDTLETPAESSNTASADAIQIGGPVLSDLQVLRERVQLLEQRISQPTGRESDLEMVLGIVWQALVRSGSEDGQPESPVWRLVQRHARNVLSTTTGPALPVQANLDALGGQGNSAATLNAEDWVSLINYPSIPVPSKGICSDSGYNTGR